MEEKTKTLVLNGVTILISTVGGMTKMMTHRISDSSRLEPLIRAIEELQSEEDKEDTAAINKFEDFLDSII